MNTEKRLDAIARVLQSIEAKRTYWLNERTVERRPAVSVTLEYTTYGVGGDTWQVYFCVDRDRKHAQRLARDASRPVAVDQAESVAIQWAKTADLDPEQRDEFACALRLVEEARAAT